MTDSIEDTDIIWSTNKHLIKIWATSKVSLNRYLSDAKSRFNHFWASERGVNYSPLEHVEIVRNEARYFFEQQVSENTRQGSIKGEAYLCFENKIYAFDLRKES